MSAPNKVKTDADAYTGPEKLASAFDRPLALSSRAIHADDYINNHQAVAPPLHVSTTYRYSDDPEQLENLLNVSVCCVPSSTVQLGSIGTRLTADSRRLHMTPTSTLARVTPTAHVWRPCSAA